VNWLCSSDCTTQTQAILYLITSAACNKFAYRMCKVLMHDVNRLKLSNLNMLDGNGQFTLFSELGSFSIFYSYSVSLLGELYEVLLQSPQGLIEIFDSFHFM